MRVSRANRTDANQREIVDHLRQRGASVQQLQSVGNGCPDLLVGFHGRNYLLEIKLPPGKGTDKRRTQPNQLEAAWHEAWGGQVTVVRTAEDCDRLLGVDFEDAP